MFDWDDTNLDHIAVHGISAEDAEAALLDPRRIPAPAYSISSERRRAILGTTEEGRMLFVVFTHRQAGIRVITARLARDRERQRYGRGRQ